jgi:hypothetical protein
VDEQTARDNSSVSTERNHATDDTFCAIPDSSLNDNVIDLYSVVHERGTKTENPFTHYLRLHSANGEITRVKALFDGGAMVGAMCTSVFRRVQHRLGSWYPSQCRLRMANGVIVRSQAMWKGVMELGGIRVEGEFEVFDSNQGWGILFGKPLLRAFNAVHDYGTDVVTISSPTTKAVVRLHNQINDTLSNTTDEQGISLTLDVKQWEELSGGTSDMNPPSRQVLMSPEKWYEIPFDKHKPTVATTHIQESAVQMDVNEAVLKSSSNTNLLRDTTTVENCPLSMSPQTSNKELHVIKVGGIEQPPLREVLIDLEADRMNKDIDNPLPDTPSMINEISTDSESIFTRHSDPFKPERVAKILSEVRIGSDVTPKQHRDILDLVKEFADCFALAISEVNTVPGAVHKLNIPPDATFRTKIGQRSLNAPQKAFIHSKVDEMLAARIIEPIHPRDVRAVAPTVLARKTHDGQGLPLDELKHLVNDQCVENGLPSMPDLPLRPTSVDNDGSSRNARRY